MDLECQSQQSKHDTLPIPVYVISNELITESAKIPHIGNRTHVTHTLIQSYGLLDKMRIVKVIPATENDLSTFHSRLYIEYLKKLSNFCNDAIVHSTSSNEDEFLFHGIEGYDCPKIEGIYNFASIMAGATITACRCLVKGWATNAINWCGGWHHAQRDEAEGFCYVNDIVLGIQHLKTVFQKVLYIDLDIHHGNGVENAYKCSRDVFTLSIHKYEPGFYPGTGSLEDTGLDMGKYHCVNVPLKEGISDRPYVQIFKSITKEILGCFNADAVVVQCGADCLTGDKLGGFNLTPVAMGNCVKEVLSWKKPTLYLGGGGYNNANSARCWTYITSLIVGCDISNDIPETQFFENFGPDFTISITPSNMKDFNSDYYISSLIKKIADNLDNIKMKRCSYLQVASENK